MPQRTRVPCSWPGCAELIQPGGGHCDTHKKERWSRQNKIRRTTPGEAELDSFYSKGVWQRARMMHIRNSPLCVRCGQAGAIVDHIVPRRAGGDSLAPDNLQTLCRSCHAIKTIEDERTF